MKRWCVAQTQPQRETQAKENLLDQQFEVFFPLLRQTKGKDIQLKPLFPRYLFVAVDTEIDRWKSINGTRGVYKLILSNPERPAFLPTAWVDGMLEKGGIVDAVEKNLVYEVGQLLEFLDGPLKGRFGMCRWSDQDRVALLITMLGHERTVHVRHAAVRAVSEARIV